MDGLRKQKFNVTVPGAILWWGRKNEILKEYTFTYQDLL